MFIHSITVVVVAAKGGGGGGIGGGALVHQALRLQSQALCAAHLLILIEQLGGVMADHDSIASFDHQNLSLSQANNLRPFLGLISSLPISLENK